ncbi:MAG: hypothetical protein E6K53_10360 [Gammaproteobacteria bacterium]|nr:MAG: hypothetical protein E6K53_10360 [Gammaproteobacteria bacterium]
MKQTTIACAIVLAFAATAIAPARADTPRPTAAAAAAATAPKLHAAMRGLWQGHVQRTRAYAVAVKAGDAAAADKATKDVVANATDIANAVAGFYGDAAGKQMLQLLAGHWGAVKALTDAAKKNDAAGQRKAMDDLSANGDAIATFLSGANPNLPKEAVLGLLTAHVGHHAAQVDEIMKGDTAGEAVTWKAMQAHMDTLADALSDGIAKQFPSKAT